MTVGHHEGVLLKPLGEVGSTRWADWFDLALPALVLGTAGATLWASRAPARAWAIAAIGAVIYAEGHGIHLAANSIGNAEPSEVAHLWDETVSHVIWYSGLTVLVVALGVALIDTPIRARVWTTLLAVAFGLTLATNAIEGGTAWLGLVVAVALSAWGWRHRRRAGLLLVVAYATSFLALGGWAAYWHGFPQFSELGWV